MAVAYIAPIAPHERPDIQSALPGGPGAPTATQSVSAAAGQPVADSPAGAGFGPAAEVSISPQARAAQAVAAPDSTRPVEGATESQTTDPVAEGEDATESPATDNRNPLSPEEELTREEQQKVEEMKRRDAEVRAHEQAHKAAGGPHTGPISYQYTTGPDNRRYVSGGEVSVDLSPVANNPQATVQKMRVIKRAALAPANPSGADRAVHAQASRKEQKAQAEFRAENAEKIQKVLDRPTPERPSPTATTSGEADPLTTTTTPEGWATDAPAPATPPAPTDAAPATSTITPMSRFQHS